MSDSYSSNTPIEVKMAEIALIRRPRFDPVTVTLVAGLSAVVVAAGGGSTGYSYRSLGSSYNRLNELEPKVDENAKAMNASFHNVMLNFTRLKTYMTTATEERNNMSKAITTVNDKINDCSQIRLIRKVL